MILLAIDPGNTYSAVLTYDTERSIPIFWDYLENVEARVFVGDSTADALAIEAIASYGMAVGAEIFATCIAVGRFMERWNGPEARLIYRPEVKLHLCQSRRAKDANVRQALIDKFGPGKELAIGKKKTPGPLYGLTGDCWAALGVAVTAAETHS